MTLCRQPTELFANDDYVPNYREWVETGLNSAAKTGEIVKWFQDRGFGTPRLKSGRTDTGTEIPSSLAMYLYDGAPKSKYAFKGNLVTVDCDEGTSGEQSYACVLGDLLFYNVNEHFPPATVLMHYQAGARDFPIADDVKPRIADTIAHELFHAVQFKPDREKTEYEFLIEGSAEAVGNAWARRVYGESDERHDSMELDTPFHQPLSDYIHYARGRFYTWFGNQIGSPDGVGYLKELTGNYPPANPPLETLERLIESNSSEDFLDLFARYIAQEHNKLSSYAALSGGTGATVLGRLDQLNVYDLMKKVPLIAKISGSADFIHETRFENIALPPVAATADVIKAQFSFDPEPRPEQRLRHVTITPDFQKSRDQSALSFVYENLIKNHEPVQLLVIAEPEVPIGLTRMINASRALSKTDTQVVDYTFRDAPAELRFPTCVEPATVVTLDEQFAQFDNREAITLSADRGLFGKNANKFRWTVGAREGIAKVSVEIADFVTSDNKQGGGKQKRPSTLTDVFEVRVSNQCDARITLQGERPVIYDSAQDVSVMRDGESIMAIRPPSSVFAFEPDTGWCHMDLSIFGNMIFGRVNSILQNKMPLAQDLDQVAGEFQRHGQMNAAIETRQAANDLRNSSTFKDGHSEGYLRQAGKEDQLIAPTGHSLSAGFAFLRPYDLSERFSPQFFRSVTKARHTRSNKEAKIEIGQAQCRHQPDKKCLNIKMSDPKSKRNAIEFLYDPDQLISRMSVVENGRRDEMFFDYGSYSEVTIPLAAKSCLRVD